MSRVDEAVLRRVVRALFGRAGPDAHEPGCVGVELELIPRSTTGCPTAPGDRSLERLAVAREVEGGFSFEPGGQLEYSTPAHRSLADLDMDLAGALDPLRAAAREAGIELDARGLAPGFGPEDVGLRQRSPRYVEMDRYFARLGPWGPWMMRCTASLQVNLDLGAAGVGGERWRLLNALTPVLVATFANSAADLADGTPLVSGRAWIWSRLDPARTGSLATSPAGGAPWSEYRAFALAAPVMFDAATRSVAQADGRVPTFGEWWARHAMDSPTVADWRTHLGTLFPDVRPRGWLEVRPVDVPERAWWSVPPSLLAGLAYDERARREATEMLTALARKKPDVMGRAMRRGLGDPDLAEAAATAFRLADAALRRLPTGYTGSARRAADAFRERYVEAGRTQADEARERGEIVRLVPADHAVLTGASLPPRPS